MRQYTIPDDSNRSHDDVHYEPNNENKDDKELINLMKSNNYPVDNSDKSEVIKKNKRD